MSFFTHTKPRRAVFYDLAGGLLREFSVDVSGKAEWDTNETASGIYLYIVVSPEGTKKGKISVIK